MAGWGGSWQPSDSWRASDESEDAWRASQWGKGQDLCPSHAAGASGSSDHWDQGKGGKGGGWGKGPEVGKGLYPGSFWPRSGLSPRGMHGYGAAPGPYGYGAPPGPPGVPPRQPCCAMAYKEGFETGWAAGWWASQGVQKGGKPGQDLWQGYEEDEEWDEEEDAEKCEEEAASSSTSKKKKKKGKSDWQDRFEKRYPAPVDLSNEYFECKTSKTEWRPYPEEIQKKMRAARLVANTTGDTQDVEYDMLDDWVYILRIWPTDSAELKDFQSNYKDEENIAGMQMREGKERPIRLKPARTLKTYA